MCEDGAGFFYQLPDKPNVPFLPNQYTRAKILGNSSARWKQQMKSIGSRRSCPWWMVLSDSYITPMDVRNVRTGRKTVGATEVSTFLAQSPSPQGSV